MVILDSRPYEEYHNMSIPGGIFCGGGELVHKVFEVADPETLVVVNCAGRTRSILGTQSLVNAGVTNVAACRNGTMGWHLAGLEVAKGATDVVPAPGPPAVAKAREAARRVASKFGVTTCSWADVATWLAQGADRTTCLLDVRLPEEYHALHVAGSRSAPGGQLTQATDEYIVTLGSRIVLIDGGEAVRAPMTASWLLQMGLSEVHVLDGGIHAVGAELTSEPFVPAALLAPGPAPRLVSGWVLQLWLSAGVPETVAVLDVGRSTEYRKGHIPGAVWVSRSVLCGAAAPDRLPKAQIYVLTDSVRGTRAARVAPDVARLTSGSGTFALAGGTAAWPGKLEVGEGVCVAPPMDVAYKVYEHSGAVEPAMEAYLQWEYELCAKVLKDGDAAWPGLRYYSRL